jgi:hypothetical protein
LIPIRLVAETVEELKGEGRIAVLLEPASPYADQYSLVGVTVPEQQKIIVEVVGPGFDASDILRGDIQAHERWELPMHLTSLGRGDVSPPSAERLHLTTSEQYGESVQLRLAKIGARIKNPAFPDVVLRSESSDAAQLRKAGMSYLKAIRQTALLKHAKSYIPVPQEHLISFAKHIQRLLLGLGSYGIHLGPSSFASSLIPKRGLVFWDFFPARKQEASSLYPAV